MYYNTNNETGETLQESRETAKTQSGAILQYFRDNPGEELTPFEIKAKLRMRAPITSIRRAISDLTTEGMLEKTDTLKAGNYGKKCHCWKLA